ncbi:MAG: hypothetical protein JSV58_03550 [Candidatus Bathyarchaeota archaeon]|nr:MAG: hypothetical protein JSV58_03550 [Candidatus Bathyarchaeota archaeon]
MKTARAFCPAGISSFFQICDKTKDGEAITDPARVGARGGGFAIETGVSTEVRAVEAEEERISIFIDGKPAPYAETTRTVAESLLREAGKILDIAIEHRVDVPIGAGFGSSAAGALGTALALSRMLGINLTYNQLGRIAHVAEVKCLTGLGTVGPLLLGGCAITTEPGAPGYSVIDRIPISSDHRIVAVTYRPLPTKDTLLSQERRPLINKWGLKTVERIVGNPSLENFMQASKEFALKTGFATGRIKRLIAVAEKAGAVGAAQNMLGEAVHALVTSDRLEDVIKALKQAAVNKRIVIAKLDFQGARWLK